MSKANDIKQKLEQIILFIEEAQKKLQEGEVINLSHLDGEVEALCQQTLQLPPSDAIEVQPIMGNMITKLEELGVALKDFQSNLKEQNNI